MQYEFCKSQMMNLIVFWDFLFRYMTASSFSLTLLRLGDFEPPVVQYLPSDLNVISQTLLGILKINLSFLHSQRSSFKHALFHI